MIRWTIFIIALLLAVSAIEPTGPWLVTLAVLAGVELVAGRRRRFVPPLPRWRSWRWERWADESDW